MTGAIRQLPQTNFNPQINAPKNMANTIDSNLVVESLKRGAITVLANKFAPWKSISRSWETDPVRPRATCEIKFATAGSTTLTNPSSFESGDSVVSAIPVTVSQYSQPFQISNSDLQGGLALDDLIDVNASAFALKINQIIMAPLTTGIFTNEVYISAAAAFGLSDLALLRGRLKKARARNLLLDGDYFSQITNQPGFYQPTGTSSGNGWKPYGWDYIAECSDWSGAGAGVVGFACSPEALGFVAGLPAESPSSGQVLTRQSIELPGLGIQVAYHVWFALSTRTLWASYDLMLGAAACDTSAGILIKSA